MTKEEFIEEVRKELLAGYYPGDDGKREQLSEEYVDYLLHLSNWFKTQTLVEDYYDDIGNYKSERFCIEAAANDLWTADNC